VVLYLSATARRTVAVTTSPYRHREEEVTAMNTDSLEARIGHPITYPLARCPECGSARLDPVVEARVGEVHFLCRDCDRCWNVDFGFVQRVAPATCLGCPERARCERAYTAERATTAG
jgi:hypothetical protein